MAREIEERVFSLHAEQAICKSFVRVSIDLVAVMISLSLDGGK